MLKYSFGGGCPEYIWGLFFRSERFVRFSLYFLDIGAIDFVLMLLKMLAKLVLGIKKLVANIALNQSFRSQFF